MPKKEQYYNDEFIEKELKTDSLGNQKWIERIIPVKNFYDENNKLIKIESEDWIRTLDYDEHFGESFVFESKDKPDPDEYLINEAKKAINEFNRKNYSDYTFSQLFSFINEQSPANSRTTRIKMVIKLLKAMNKYDEPMERAFNIKWGC